MRVWSCRLRGIAIRGALGACLIAVCSSVVGVAHAAAPPDRQGSRAPRTAATAAPSATRTLYWGAWIGNQLTGSEAPWDASAVSAFERETGKGVSLVNFSSPFANCYSTPCRTYPFDAAAMNLIRGHGAIPFFSWGSDSVPVSVNEPNFSLASIVAGTWDAYITKWAQDAKAWGHPFFLRFDWEMNANWFPWSVGVNGNTSADYVAAWRHVHDIFAKVGATNVTWVWCPNIDPNHQYASLASVYPGNGCNSRSSNSSPTRDQRRAVEADRDRGNGVGRARWREGGLDRRRAHTAASRALSPDTCLHVVRQVRFLDGLADRDLYVGRLGLRRRHLLENVCRQRLRIAGRHRADPAARITATRALR